MQVRIMSYSKISKIVTLISNVLFCHFPQILLAVLYSVGSHLDNMTFNLAVGVLTLAIMAAYVQCRPSDDVVDIPLKPTDNTCVLKEPKVPGPEDTEESGVPETRREIQGHSKCNAADEKDVSSSITMTSHDGQVF